MTAKEYLEEIHKFRREIHALQLSIEELTVQIEGLKAIDYSKVRVQTSPVNMLEELAGKLLDAKEEYARQILLCHREIRQRVKQIRVLRGDYAAVLLQRYVETDPDGLPLTWRRIASNLHRSVSSVMHIHSRALTEFNRVHGKSVQTYANKCVL